MCLRAKGSTHHTAASEAALGRVAAEQALNALLGGHVATELGYVAAEICEICDSSPWRSAVPKAKAIYYMFRGKKVVRRE